MLIPGNHDEAMREYDGVSFGDILVGANTSTSPPTASATCCCMATNSTR
jgi:hypothetical protein